MIVSKKISALNFFLFFGFFLFCTQNSFAKNDPFVDLNKEIKKLEDIANNSEFPAGLEGKCTSADGAKIRTDYKLSFTKFSEELSLKHEYAKASKCFNNGAKAADERLSRVVRDFPKSGASCIRNEYYRAKNQLEVIVSVRNSLYKRSITDKKFFDGYNSANCESDSKSKIFEETTRLWKEFKADMEELKKGMKELDTGSISFWSLDKKKKENISARAKVRGENYVNDFAKSIESAIYDPLYRTRSGILTKLENLPKGKSHFSGTSYSLPWLSSFAKKGEENIIKKNIEYDEKKAEIVPQFYVQQVNKIQTIEYDKKKYLQKLESYIKIEEKYQRFDPAFSQSVIDSLAPFHETLKETDVLLKRQKKALHSVLNKQNRGID